MVPMLAQGAQMAMEDGYVLARAFEAHGDPEAALASYEEARRERAARVVRGSAENARRFHNPELAKAESAAQFVDREWQPDRVSDRYDWLFTYDATSAAV